jgi:hypothetical protein
MIPIWIDMLEFIIHIRDSRQFFLKNGEIVFNGI